MPSRMKVWCVRCRRVSIVQKAEKQREEAHCPCGAPSSDLLPWWAMAELRGVDVRYYPEIPGKAKADVFLAPLPSWEELGVSVEEIEELRAQLLDYVRQRRQELKKQKLPG